MSDFDKGQALGDAQGYFCWVKLDDWNLRNLREFFSAVLCNKEFCPDINDCSDDLKNQVATFLGDFIFDEQVLKCAMLMTLLDRHLQASDLESPKKFETKVFYNTALDHLKHIVFGRCWERMKDSEITFIALFCICDHAIRALKIFGVLNMACFEGDNVVQTSFARNYLLADLNKWLFKKLREKKELAKNIQESTSAPTKLGEFKF